MYSLANFVLFVGSLVAWKKAEGQARGGRCSIQRISCGISAWAIYPFQAAAGLTSSFVAILMFTHGLLRTMRARLDPLYVFRGVFFTLILLVPIVVVGWSSSHYIYHGDEEELFSFGDLVDTRGNRYPHFEVTPGDFGNGNTSSFRFVEMGGAFILSTLTHVSGTAFAIAMVHINMLVELSEYKLVSMLMPSHSMFGAVICGLAVALAPPTSVLVGVHRAGHGSV
ncbi:hypothetical protein MBR_07637, partial [Metarhizium brunneum ARSEF 3297]